MEVVSYRPPYPIPRNYYLQIGLDSQALLCYHNNDLHFIFLLSRYDGAHIASGDGKERAYAPGDEQQAGQKADPRPRSQRRRNLTDRRFSADQLGDVRPRISDKRHTDRRRAAEEPPDDLWLGRSRARGNHPLAPQHPYRAPAEGARARQWPRYLN